MTDYEALDKYIMRYITIKTPKEIGEMVGVEPRVVLARKDELLSSMDVLTVDQQRVKLIAELNEVIQKAMERADRTDDEYYAGMLNSAVNAQKEILKQLEFQERRNSGQIEQLNRLRVRELVKLMSMVMGELVPYLAEKYGADPEEITGVFYEKLEIEAARMEQEAD